MNKQKILRRMIITLVVLFIYRLGCFIPLPGTIPSALGYNGFGFGDTIGLFNMYNG